MSTKMFPERDGGLTISGLQPRPEEAWPFYDADEIEAVVEVLRSGKVNQWTSHVVTDFQNACARMFGGQSGLALANGSVALELPLRVFGIGPGDEVVVTPRSFVASAACVRLVGATPVFADVDPRSGNITVDSIKAVMTGRTKAIIPVHLAGWPCDMPGIMRLAEANGLRVIEDCAQAHGAEIDGRPVGSFGDAAAYSFCQDKIVSTGGEGGYTSFRDQADWQRAWSFKDHGKNFFKATAEPASTGFRWLHDTIGTNWRLTAPQAAIGLRQLEKLHAWRDLRTENADVWKRALSEVPGLEVPLPADGYLHAFYKLYFYVMGPNPEEKRDEILRKAQQRGIRIFTGACPEIYLEQAFSDLARPHLPEAQLLGQRSLLLEVHPTLNRARLAERAEVLGEISRAVLA